MTTLAQQLYQQRCWAKSLSNQEIEGELFTAVTTLNATASGLHHAPQQSAQEMISELLRIAALCNSQISSLMPSNASSLERHHSALLGSATLLSYAVKSACHPEGMGDIQQIIEDTIRALLPELQVNPFQNALQA